MTSSSYSEGLGWTKLSRSQTCADVSGLYIAQLRKTSLTNEEVKDRIRNIFRKFVLGIEPDRLCDWLVQENVITSEQWQIIQTDYSTRQSRCRALLHYLYSIPHPRAFLVVYQYLTEEDHYLLESIDDQESTRGSSSQPNIRTVSREQNNIQGLENNHEDQKSVWEAEKDGHILKIQKDFEDQKRVWEAEKNDCLFKMQIEFKDQKRAWEAELNAYLQKIQNELEDQKRAWEAEKNACLQKMQIELEDQKKAWEAEKNGCVPKSQKGHEDQKRACEAEKNRLHQIAMEPKAKLHLGYVNKMKSMFNPNQNIQQEKQSSTKDKETSVGRVREMLRFNGTGSLPNKYRFDPIVVQTIRTEAATGKTLIRGMAILGNELFIVNERRSEVEAYDSTNFSLSGQWTLPGLIKPWDIGSCNKIKYLYIFDYKGNGQSNEIFRINPYRNRMLKWSTGEDWGDGLSVTAESNVILTVFEKNKLIEYSQNGQMIREINLSSDAGISWPLHAIKLTNGHFVVSHGYFEGDLNRVCVVDANGKLKKTFGEKRGSTIGQLNDPIHLSIDSNGFVLVADRGNSRIVLLNSDMEFQREILTKETHGFQCPSRILLDESNIRLFLANNDDSPSIEILHLPVL